MSRSIGAAMIVLSLLPRPTSADEAGEAAIRKIVAEQVTAWNAGDGAAYARHLAPEAAFTNLFAMVMYGAPAFAKRHGEILSTFYKGTTKRHVIRRIRFVTPEVGDRRHRQRSAWREVDARRHRRPSGRRVEDAADGSLRSPWRSMGDRGVSQRRPQAVSSGGTMRAPIPVCD
jgi:hypothetical protein